MTKNNKSKNVSECPSLLAEYIRVVNLVPPNMQMPDWFEIDKRINQEYIDAGGEDFWKLTGRILSDEELKTRRREISRITDKANDECLSKLPPEFNEYIIQKAELEAARIVRTSKFPVGKYTFIDNVITCKGYFYSIFVKDRENLRKLAQYLEALRKSNDKTHGGLMLYGKKKGVEILFPTLEASVWITEEDRVEIMPTGLTAAVNGIDGTRLRICEICSKLYWAKRKDAETCSPSCRNSYRQKRFYEQNKEELKAARKARYQHAKRQKQIKGEK